jgi:uncharacterized protein (TIGR03382 family)
MGITRARIVALGSALLAPAAAAADTVTDSAVAERPLVQVTRPDGVILARQIVEGPAPDLVETAGTQAIASSLYIYLNKNGTTLSPGGTNNSSTNVSTIVPNTRNFPAWNVSAANWAIVVTATQEMFAPFGVTVSDVAPPPGTRHIEALFGGTASDALPANQVPPPDQGVILGVSPFTTDCSIIEDSIVFTFAASAVQVGQTPREIAEIAAQEIAHSFGLDHVLNASDPMTYLPYNGNRSFKAGAVSCGEDQPRQCGLVLQGFPACRPNQDSVALLTERLGPGGLPTDTTPPTVSIDAPRDNDIVPPGFEVYAAANDNIAVTSVELYIDDILVDSATSTPYTFSTPTSIALGEHEVTIIATDGQQQAVQTINVIVDDGADPVDPPPPGGNGGDGGDNLVTGGCSAGGGGGAGLLLAFALLGVVRRRR